MINNDNDSVLDSVVAKAIVGAIRNPFDKKICSNCKNCSAKGEVKYFCGVGRSPVASDGSCSKFMDKPIKVEQG